VAFTCSRNQAYLYDKGGTRRLTDLPAEAIRWGRARDDISYALVTMPYNQQCAEKLADIEPGRHELVIFRGDDRVWEGPITRKPDFGGSLQIEAKDVMQYTYWCIIRRGFNDQYPNCKHVTDRCERLLRQELVRLENASPSCNVLDFLDVRHREDGPRECQIVLPYQKLLWEQLDHFARYSGIDYTAIGRRILIFDTHDETIGRSPVLTERDFIGDVPVVAYGAELATFVGATDGQGHYGWAGSADSYYGLIEKLNTIRDESSTSTEPPSREALMDSATSYLRGRNPTPRFVRPGQNATLNPNSALTIDMLVPGIRVPVRANLTADSLQQELKLDTVVVEENSRGETIKISLGPAPGGVAVLPEGSDLDDETEEEPEV
jgi:hypothetical protein